jgi:hypothetical protein
MATTRPPSPFDSEASLKRLYKRLTSITSDSSTSVYLCIPPYLDFLCVKILVPQVMRSPTATFVTPSPRACTTPPTGLPSTAGYSTGRTASLATFSSAGCRAPAWTCSGHQFVQVVAKTCRERTGTYLHQDLPWAGLLYRSIAHFEAAFRLQ